MTSKKLVILGVIILLVQISGIPSSWKSAFFIILGIFLIIISMKGYFKSLSEKEEAGSISNFIDKQDNADKANEFSSTEKTL